MFRERPLTWLFILATVVVDLALPVTWEGSPILVGAVIGQIAAVSIWTVIGHPHRLIRGSLIVVAFGALALMGHPSPSLSSRALSFAAVYSPIVVLTSLVIVWLRNKIRFRFNEALSPAPLRIPLIELFGWTIVVAIASLGVRQVEPSFFDTMLRSPSRNLVVFSVAPIALFLFDVRYRPSHLVKAVLFVGGMYMLQRSHISALETASLAAYLTAWLLVRSIEYDNLKTAEENDDATELDADE
jgi:hypothetical protein